LPTGETHSLSTGLSVCRQDRSAEIESRRVFLVRDKYHRQKKIPPVTEKTSYPAATLKVSI